MMPLSVWVIEDGMWWFWEGDIEGFQSAASEKSYTQMETTRLEFQPGEDDTHPHVKLVPTPLTLARSHPLIILTHTLPYYLPSYHSTITHNDLR